MNLLCEKGFIVESNLINGEEYQIAMHQVFVVDEAFISTYCMVYQHHIYISLLSYAVAHASDGPEIHQVQRLAALSLPHSASCNFWCTK